MGDEIAQLHQRNILRKLYSKSLFMSYTKAPYAAALRVANLPWTNRYLGPNLRPYWLPAGNIAHNFADQLHDLAKDHVDDMQRIVSTRDVQLYLSGLVDWDNLPMFLWNSFNNLVAVEADRWTDCMRFYAGDSDKMFEYWSVPYRELYIENTELQMALNIDRIERVPGTDNEYCLVEFKKKVHSSIRKELAWYWVGSQDWCADQGIEITHWRAIGYDAMWSNIHARIFKNPKTRKNISITGFNKVHPRFNRYMNALVDARLKYEETGETQPLVQLLEDARSQCSLRSIWCKFCNYSQHCHTKTHYDDITSAPEMLQQWEIERRQKNMRLGRYNPLVEPHPRLEIP